MGPRLCPFKKTMGRHTNPPGPPRPPRRSYRTPTSGEVAELLEARGAEGQCTATVTSRHNKQRSPACSSSSSLLEGLPGDRIAVHALGDVALGPGLLGGGPGGVLESLRGEGATAPSSRGEAWMASSERCSTLGLRLCSAADLCPGAVPQLLERAHRNASLFAALSAAGARSSPPLPSG